MLAHSFQGIRGVNDLRNRLETALGGGYAVERELAGGAASRLFLAVEQALNRQVVVKVLAAEGGEPGRGGAVQAGDGADRRRS